MKIHETIRAKRTVQGLTQEQVAERLGVSVPAVSKWENAVTYPDITLLPSLARLLDVDLNTLLSFEDDLDDTGINRIIEEISAERESGGIGRALEAARAKTREYPTCDKLALSIALTLDGWLMLSEHKEAEQLECENFVESLYLRTAESADEDIRQAARCMMANRLRASGENDEAAELMELLPESAVKRQMRASLLIERGNIGEAALITEQGLLEGLESTQSALLVLLSIALREERPDDALHIADVYREVSELFSLSEYSSHVAHFELYSSAQDAERCLDELEAMLPALLEPWSITDSPLFRHIPEKEGGSLTGAAFLPKILSELEDEENDKNAFIRNSPRFKKLARELREN